MFLLFDFRFAEIHSSISLSYEDSEYKIFAKGNIKKWEFGNYDWETIDFSTNFENSKISDINIVAKSQYEDELKFKIESNKDYYFVSHFDGILKDNLFSFKPFYIRKKSGVHSFLPSKLGLCFFCDHFINQFW